MYKSGDLVRVKEGLRKGQIGKIVERASETQPIYQVQFPLDSNVVYFFEDEIELAERFPDIPCPKCAFQGVETKLSEPYQTEEGWVQDCPIHGKLYLWRRWRIIREEIIN